MITLVEPKMQSGIVFLPDGQCEPSNRIPDDVVLKTWPQMTEEEQDAAIKFIQSLPRVSRNDDVQNDYEIMRLCGESHNMAEMFATKSFCGLKTDAIFNEGRFSGHSNEECTARGTWLRREAEKHGVSTTGKWYCSGLASFPGDPTAWVGDRGDVLRVAEAKNMTVRGYVEHKGHEVDPGGDIAIAEDIIESEVAGILEECPEANADEVREEVYAVRTGAVDNHDLHVSDHNFGNPMS